MRATRIGCMGAADFRLGSSAARSRNIGRTVRAGLATAPQLWALVLLCGSLITVQQFHPLAFRAPAVRAVIETEITLCALVTACLFALSFEHRRRVRDLILVGALVGMAVIDLVSYVLPAAISIRSSGLFIAAPTLGMLFLSATLAAAALVPPQREVPHNRRRLGLAVGVGVLGATVAEIGGVALPHGAAAVAPSLDAQGFNLALAHPLGLSASLASAALLGVAAIHLARQERGSARSVTMLLAAGMAVFAAARLNFLVLPAASIGWVTVDDGLRIAAYGLLLAAALRQEAAIRQAIADTAAVEERRRIARDLHDGLAQDLAFIAAHGDRLAGQVGREHPLALAARRALVVARGAITDLSSSGAPSVRAALRRVADELEIRFGVRVELDADETALSPEARDDVVRIVREAIVNAAKGEAQNITVSLTRRDNLSVLRVLDDGAGIKSDELAFAVGFGLRSMRERAASLGGGLTARDARGGGTEVEVVFP